MGFWEGRTRGFKSLPGRVEILITLILIVVWLVLTTMLYLSVMPVVAIIFLTLGIALLIYRHTMLHPVGIRHYERASIVTDYRMHLKPKTYVAYLNHASLLQHHKELDKALRESTKAISLNPKSALTFFVRGTIYLQQNRFDEAIADFHKVILRLPDSPSGYFYLAYINGRKGNSLEAIALYNEAILREPDNTIYYNNRGYNYALTGDLKAAIEDCNQALKLDPKLSYAYNSRAVAYFLSRRFNEAMDGFTQGKNLDSESPFPIAGLAIVHSAKGQMEEAKQLWMSLIAMDSRYKDVETLKTEYNCPEPMLKEARKIVEDLDLTNKGP
jgi:tetratricopeptide (TPR) repeat protein